MFMKPMDLRLKSLTTIMREQTPAQVEALSPLLKKRNQQEAENGSTFPCRRAKLKVKRPSEELRVRHPGSFICIRTASARQSFRQRRLQGDGGHFASGCHFVYKTGNFKSKSIFVKGSGFSDARIQAYVNKLLNSKLKVTSSSICSEAQVASSSICSEA
ncbi:hypothetical protein R1flu_010505 [Riccia fluitans]|uniref:Uncharacterized protein n=1 Tax=Riccia fluitans TaxID=41844 RepID=A0ABD1Z626_9MARC